jgi:hypothetical protein
MQVDPPLCLKEFSYQALKVLSTALKYFGFKQCFEKLIFSSLADTFLVLRAWCIL